MNFYRLRFINTLLLFLLGILIGFMLQKKDIFKEWMTGYKPIYPANNSDLQITPIKRENINYSSFTLINNKDNKPKDFNENNPMDSDEEYILPVETEKSTENINTSPNVELETFLSNPASFAGKNISGKIQMIIAKKLEKGWRLNFVFSDKNKNFVYIYIDDIDNISGDNPDYKIGYFYNVVFNSGQGDLKKGNKLISISPTGEKTSWASGVSAVEY